MKTFTEHKFLCANNRTNFKTLGFVIILMLVTAVSSNVKAQCGSIPYTEDFESGFPSCWTRNNDGQVVINNNFQTNNTSFLQINGLGSPGGIATTGDIDVSGESAVEVTWDISEGANNDPEPPADNLTVEYFDGTQYVEIVVYNASITSWQTDSFIISSGLTSQFNLRFTSVGSGNNFDDWDIDNVEVTSGPNCPPPSALTTSSITTTSVDLSWTGTSPAPGNGYDWEIVPAGNGQGNGVVTSNNTTNTSVTATGLSGNTEYDAYVRANCGGGDGESIYIGPVNFRTAPEPAQGLNCNAGGSSSVLFSEEFDDNSAGWTGDVGTGNDNWEIPDASGSNNTGADNAFSGSNYMNFEASSTATTAQGSIISPAIDLTVGQTDAELSFYMHAYGEDMGTLEVGVGTSPTGPFTNEFTWSGQLQTDGADAWVNVGVDLSSYVGQTIYIELIQIDDQGGFTGDMSIDLFEVSTCVACPSPNGLAVNNINATSADLSWTGTSPAPASGYDWEIVPAGNGQGNGVVAKGNTGNTSVTATGLTANTEYDAFVRANCGGSQSSYIGPISFLTSCGAISAITLPFNEDFETTNNLTTSSDDNLECGSDFTLTYETEGLAANDGEVQFGTDAPEASNGSGAMLLHNPNGEATNNVILTLDMSNYTTGDDIVLNFDYRDSGDEVDAEDRVFVRGSDTDTWLEIFDWSNNATGNFQTESGLDISTLLANNSQSFSSSFQVRFGQNDNASYTGDGVLFDDIVVEEITCAAPTNLSTANILASQVDLSWTAPSPAPAGGYDWEIVPAGNGQGNGVVASGNTANTSVNATGLDADSDYDAYVRANCGGGDESFYTGPQNFTTPVFSPPQGFTCNSGSNAVVLSKEFDNQGNWTGDFGGSNGEWQINSGGTTSGSTGPDDAHSGSNYVYFEASGINSGYPNETASIVSDAIDLTQANDFAELSFFLHAFGSEIGTLNVGVGNSATGPFTTEFTISGEQQTASSDPYENIGINLDAYVGQTIFLEFEYTSGNGLQSDLALDLVEVSTCLDCAPPSNLNTSNITATSADLDWTAPASAPSSGYDWEIVPAGNGQGNGVVANANTGNTSITASGLSANTEYDAYVRANCSGGDQSSYIGPATFTTDIAPPQGFTCNSGSNAVVLSKEFDNQGNWTGDFDASGGDWEINSGGTGSTGTGPDAAFSGTNYVHFEASGATNTTAAIVSDAIDLSNANDFAELSFWLHAFGDDIGTLNVGVGTSPGGPFTTEFTTSGEKQTADTDPWINAGVNLDAYVGQTIYLEFEYTSGGSFRSDLALDLVEVSTCLDCAPPSNLTTANITATDVDLDWDASPSSPTNGYDWEIVPAGNGQGNGVVTSNNTTNTSVTATGLTANTEYDAFVRANCGGGDGESSYIGPVSFTTNCNPFTAPYSENFDGASSPQQPYESGVDCWATTGSGANDIDLVDAGANDVTEDPPSLPNAFELNDGNFGNGDVAILVSPQFSDLPSGNNRIRFQAGFENTSAELTVGVMSDPTDPTTFEIIQTITTGTADVFEEYIVNLDDTSTIGSDEYVAFRHGSSIYEISIDDFVYEEIPTLLSSTSPINKENGIDQSSSIDLTFNQVVSATNLSNALEIQGSESGPIAGTISGGGTTTLTFDPTDDFYPGEEVSVYLGDNLISNSPQSFQFRVASDDLGTETLDYDSMNIDNMAGLPYRVIAANLDGDAELEIASINGDDAEVVWYKQDGTKNVIFSNASQGRDITAADIDQDGDVDLLTASFGNDRIDWFENDGNGNFTTNNISTSVSSATKVEVVDIDGDLDQDIISTSRGDNEIYFHENDGSQNFTRSTIVNQDSPSLRPWNIDVGDLDQDGDVDIVVGSSSDGIFYFINDGSNNFTSNTLETNSGTWGVKRVDMENDGDVDIVAAIRDNNEIVWFENNGSLSFTRNVILSGIDAPRRAIPADLNGDGDIDIAYSASGDDSANGTDDAQIGILINDGSQSFTEQVISTQIDFAIGLTPVDLNNNNRLDLLVGLGGNATINTNEIRIYENRVNSWTGAVDTAWEDTGNWTIPTLPTNNDVLGIPDQPNDPVINSNAKAANIGIRSGAVVTVNSQWSLQVEESIDNDGRIIFKSDDSGIATSTSGQLGEFGANGEIRGSGDVLVERYVPQSNRAFRYISSPVNTTGTINDNLQEGFNNTDPNNNPNDISDFGTHITGSTDGSNGFDATSTGNTSMFEWDEANQEWDEIPSTNQPGDEMAVGDAYALMVRGDRTTTLNSNTAVGPATTLRFTGTLEVGDQAVAASDLSSNSGDYNLVANPYQAIVDMKTLLQGADATDLDDQTIYVYDPTLGTQGGYAAIDISMGTPTATPEADSLNTFTTDANQFILPNQAFFIETTGTNPSLTFKETYKDIAADFVDTFSDDDLSEMHINLKRQPADVLVDGVTARFDPNHTNAVNNADADEVWNFDEWVALFNSDNYLSIEKRATPVENDTIQIYTGNYQSNNYKWQIDINNINREAVLVDTYLDTETPLNANDETSIAFDIDSNIPASTDPFRFSIRFTNETLAVDDPEKTNFAVYPNPVTNNCFSISGLTGNGDTTIQLFDMTGKLVFTTTKSAKATITIDIDRSLQTGVYQLSVSQDQAQYESTLIISE